MATLPLCRQIGKVAMEFSEKKWQSGNGGFGKGLPKCGKVAMLLFWHMPMQNKSHFPENLRIKSETYFGPPL